MIIKKIKALPLRTCGIMLLVACSVFDPRDPLPPSGDDSLCYTDPFIYEYLILNIECSLSKTRLNEYLLNLASDFTFQPDVLKETPSARSWDLASEEIIMERIFSVTDSLSLVFSDSTFSVNEALQKKILWHYTGIIDLADTVYNIAGEAELDMHLIGQYWSLTSWLDIHSNATDSLNAVTFGWLKDSFLSGKLPLLTKRNSRLIQSQK